MTVTEATREMLADHPGSRSHARRGLVAVVTLTVAALALGFGFIGQESVWFDESFSVMLARKPWDEFWFWSWHAELNGVLHYLLLRGWTAVFGVGEVAIRVPSALATAGLVPILYGLGRRLGGTRTTGIAAAAFVTVNAALVEFAHEARGYALAALLVAGAALALVVAVQDRSRRALGTFVVLGAVSVYAHLFGALAVAGVFASTLWLRPGDLPWRWRLAAATGLAIGMAPMVVFLAQAETSQVGWIAYQMAGALPRTLEYMAGGAGRLAVVMVLVVAVVALLRWAWHARSEGWGASSWAEPLVLAWLWVPIGLAVAISQAKPILVPRYLVVAVPAVSLLLALELGRLRRRTLLVTAMVVVLALQGVGLVDFLASSRSDDWRSLTSTLREESEPDEGLIVIPWYQRMPLEYYLWLRGPHDDLPQLLSPVEPWGAQPIYGGSWRVIPADELSRYDTVWLVLDPVTTQPGRPEQLAALTGRFVLADRVPFGDLQLRRYERLE